MRQRRVEAFVLDFDGDLYGEALGVEFVERLRGMEKFDDVDALVAQMTEDVVRTRSVID
jgi:riboflavin kinase/FMN adenylyltransferase